MWSNLGLSLLNLPFLLFFMKESPKYFVSIKRYDKARRVFKYIARLNRKPMFRNKLQGEDRSELNQDEPE